MVSLEFFIDIILLATYSPWVDSASNRNENQEYEYFLGDRGGWCIGLKMLPLSYANCLKIWEPQIPGTLWAFNRPVQGVLYLLLLCTMSRQKDHMLQ
jgi:hypothetical protein